MKSIYKYGLDIPERGNNKKFFTRLLPKYSQVLHIGADSRTGQPVMWVMIDTGYRSEERTFCVAGTGAEIPTDKMFEHLGTTPIVMGNIVDIDEICIWHYFEVTGGF